MLIIKFSFDIDIVANGWVLSTLKDWEVDKLLSWLIDKVDEKYSYYR